MEADRQTQQLEQVRRNIEQWRQTRVKLGAMPAPLWEEAAAAARLSGVHRVAQALRLNYDALKQHAFPPSRAEVKRPRRAPRTSTMSRATFVEVKPPSAAAAAASEPVVVEVVAASGARLTLRLNGRAVSPDLAALVASFR